MPQYIVELSGENLDLSLAELTALFASASGKCNVIRKFNNLVLVETSLSEDNVAKLAERSAMLRSVNILVKELKSLLMKELDKIRRQDYEDLQLRTRAGREAFVESIDLITNFNSKEK